MPRANFVCVLLILLACSDGTGPGTDGPLSLSARLDGRPWTPDYGSNLLSTRRPDGYLFVGAIRRYSLGGPARDAIGVQIVGFTGPGRYVFTGDPVGTTGVYALYDSATGGSTNFYSHAPNTGEVTVTELDTVAHRVAGRFSFSAGEEGGTRAVRVEQGVFRVEYTMAQ